MGYYKEAFARLTDAGVPRWYIRLYLVSGLIGNGKVYVYCNPYDVETENGWYYMNETDIPSTEADRNRMEN